MQQILRFPKGFLWGTATSAHQIEGGLTNDWSDWEKSPRRLADLKSQGLDSTEFISGSASNSWEHLDDDIACVKQISNNAYRFSLDWSRIEPEEGVFDEAAIEKYHQFVIRLRAQGIEPFVTLWHWPLPLWLRDKGGWESAAIVKYFSRFTEKVAKAMPEVIFWLTLNEPNIYAGQSYLAGVWPPQKRNPISYLRVLQHLMRAHCAAYDVIKKIKPATQVGVVTNNMDFDAAPGIINKLIASGARWWWNRRFLNYIKYHQDIIGLNYYFRKGIRYGLENNTTDKVSDIGWELYPQHIRPVIDELKRYGKPVYITENGLADTADKYRAWFLKQVLVATHAAIEAGADVRGYFHWSLIDNFEWSSGFAPKFGLFSVDHESWERSPRPSASVYAEIAKTNQVTIEE
jgi:beta-glucosidase